MEVKNGEEGEGSCLGSKGVLFYEKKIEFHMARKQFTGFGTGNSGSDFRVETLNPDSGRKMLLGSDGPGKKVDSWDFVETGLDPELTLSTTFRRIGAGLENLGNTCFLNSVLQCLTYTEPLVAYLLSGKHQNSCRIAGFCALCAIQKHVSCALKSTGRSLIPKDLVSNLRCISRNFRSARQEDAHEYMVNLLESMHKCCLPSGVPSESPAAYEKSLVHRIFGGHLRSQVECQQCLYCSNKYDPFLDLSLEIVKADTLPIALRNFTAAELLDGGEKHYQCQRCYQKVKAKKRLTVDKAPFVLTIHLKRFHALDPGRKVDKKVLFQCSLDMKPFVSGSYDGDLKYSLYGVLVHSGPSTRSGHYVCYVRTSSGIWHLLNDNEVRQVSEKTVLEQKAYMLFYVHDKKNTSPERPSDNTQNENRKATANCSIANFVVKQFSKEHIHNGPIVNKSHLESSATVNRKDALGASMEIPSKGTLYKQNNGLAMPKCEVPKIDPATESQSGAQLPKDPSRGVSFPKVDLGECLAQSTPPVKSNRDSSKLGNGVIATGVKTINCIETSNDCSVLQKPTAEELATDETSKRMNLIFDVKAPGKEQSGDSSDRTTGKAPCNALCVDSGSKTLNNVDPLHLRCEVSCQNSQGDGISNERTNGNSLSEQSCSSGHGTVYELVKLSTPAVTPNEDLHSEAPGCTPQKKNKKKALKTQILKMHVGFKFFRPFLGLKKKKHKSKLCNANTQNLIKEHLMDKSCFLSDLGPSTSKNSLKTSLCPIDQRKKGFKSGLRKRDVVRKQNNNSQIGTASRECRNRNNQNCALLAMDEHVENSILFSQAREVDRAENSKIDASILSKVTCGLEEATVPRWDGIELPPSESVASDVRENLSIGYVPDEWDEEYDRGRQKKLRHSKHDFGGPNPFQEMAAKKSSQFMKVKRDQSGRVKQPFRI